MKVGITGHRLLGDVMTRKTIRAELEARLREQTRPEDQAVSALAIGADQMFAELALDYGMSLHVVIPCQGYETTFAPGDELQGYQTLLAKASEVTTMQFPAPSEAAYEAAGRWIVDHCDLVFAVWNGKPALGRGGTGDIVAYARAKNVPMTIIPVP